MIEWISTVLHHLAALSLGTSDPTAAISFSVAVVAVAAVALATVSMAAVAGTMPAALHARAAQASAWIVATVPIAQSDPDAAGHARPRAPGTAASAA